MIKLSQAVRCLGPWTNHHGELMSMLRENVVCLANASGGELIIGVRDRVRRRQDAISGIERYDLQALRRDIYNGTDPHILVQLEVITEPEGELLVVHVPRGIPPHTTSDGLAKIRVGKDCLPLTGSLLSRLVGSGSVDLSSEAIDGARLTDLDPNQIEALRVIIGREAQNAVLAGTPWA